MSRKFANEKAREKHQEAVKLRKMTDEQLTDYVNELYIKAFNEGITYRIKELTKEISAIKGIGPKTQLKINTALEEIQ